MSKVSNFMFTNTTVGEHSTPQVLLGLVGNYAVQTDVADEAVLNNKTAPIDAQEVISFRSRNIARINNNLNIQHPAPVTGGIQYGVQVEDTLVTTDDADASFRIDEPSVVSITIRHPKSGNFNNAIVGAQVERAVSALKRADGTWRFDDLMRSAERPVTD